MEGFEDIGMTSSEFRERIDLVLQDSEYKPGIEFGIIDMTGLQASITVVLDQVVIRVSRKCERVEPQGVDGRFRHNAQVGRICFQMLHIKMDDVVAKQKPGTVGEFVQRTQSLAKVSTAKNKSLRNPRTHRSKALNPVGLGINFKINRDAPSPKRLGLNRSRF
ncbi:hypothetical protein MNBD_ALPHA09-1626 [hydrothermal vent metagenome]|uniref:Uncharacterized protein n=1 Tax=hydrothermal vent metagenome TaxID=652676 RepID=A0A3B0TWE1_9ZZZZ